MEIIQDDSTTKRTNVRLDEGTASNRTASAFFKFHDSSSPSSSLNNQNNSNKVMMGSCSAASLETHASVGHHRLHNDHHHQQQQDSRQDSPGQDKHDPDNDHHHHQGHEDDQDDDMMIDDEEDNLYAQRKHDPQGGVGGLHHPEIATFNRDQAGFILSPRKNQQKQQRPLPMFFGEQEEQRTYTGRNHRSLSSSPEIVAAASAVADETEEPVALAPRFSDPQAPLDLDWSPHFLPRTRGMSGGGAAGVFAPETHAEAVVLEPGSPTSTTARDFLREVVPCPSIPIQTAGSNVSNFTNSSYVLASGRSYSMDQGDMPPLPQHHHHEQQRDPTVRGDDGNASTTAGRPSSCTAATSNSRGRDKAVLCRSFAWSQDSQDEQRISKRARLGSGSLSTSVPSSSSSQQSSSNHNFFFSWNNSCSTSNMSYRPQSSQQQQQQQQQQQVLEESSSHFYEEEDDEHREDPASSPTLVHWEEKVIDSNELLVRAASHQEKQQQQGRMLQERNKQLMMMTTTTATTMSSGISSSSSFPPPIAPAASASQYSFDSGP